MATDAEHHPLPGWRADLGLAVSADVYDPMYTAQKVSLPPNHERVDTSH